jgi:DNA-binding Lrp family transcriptional regulator
LSKFDQSELDKTLVCYLKNNCQIRTTARELNIPRSTIRWRIKHLKKIGKICEKIEVKSDDVGLLKSIITDLKKELSLANKCKLSSDEMRRFVYDIKNYNLELPQWLVKTKCENDTTGVPSLSVSDAHWGEVVFPEQVNGINSYNLEIASKRLITLCERTIDILKNHIANPNYPGIILNFLGDMVSGNIHEELRVTNERPILPIVFNLYCNLITFINKLADAFGKVFIPCVAGNHGRLTVKVQAKNFAHENVDWHVYSLLQKYFENDNRIKFIVSDSEDFTYKVYGWKYRITHGNQFRGGDGIIGALGPIMRGDTKKRAQAVDTGESYDTLLLGHFHTLLPLRKVIANGSIVGFNEYAKSNNLRYEPPQQALWITHPVRGMTFNIPIHLDEYSNIREDNRKWVSWEE